MSIITRHSLVMVVASTPAGFIGRNGDMPWKLSTDLKRFRSITRGGALIMGRKTFDSIGRALPGRSTIVITRDKNWRRSNVSTANSPSEALDKLCSTGMQGFVVGGSSIYRVFRPKVAEIWLTKVWSQETGDTQLEPIWDNFALVECMRLSKAKDDSVPTELQRWVKANYLQQNRNYPLSSR